MDLNIVSYSIYLPISTIITVVIGRLFHKHGIVYILSLLDSGKIAHAINNLLLVGYYLLNIGYIILMIEKWPSILTINQLFNELGTRIGTIVLLLAVMHYFNILALSIAHQFNKEQSIH